MARLLTLSRYGCVSLICAILHNIIMISADAIGIHYLLATGASFLTTLVVAYTLHCRWTFRSPRLASGLLRYGGAMLANLPLSILTIGLFYRWLAMPMLWAAPLSTILQVGLNYCITAAILKPAAPRFAAGRRIVDPV